MGNSRGARRVALAYPVTLPWMALFVRGVSEYGLQHGGWILTASLPAASGAGQSTLNVGTLKGWPGDGAILAINSAAEMRAAVRLGIPVVNLSGTLEKTEAPRVTVDYYAMGRLAAEHLLQRGLRHLAYCGIAGPWFARRRGEGFCDRAQEAGVLCERFEMPMFRPTARRPWRQCVAPLDRWLKRLKTPVGVMAVHDHLARIVIDECLRLGLDVPHHVAVIGNDNDTIVCDFCRPTLSSVLRNAWRVGYESAGLLDRLMMGETPPSRDLFIAPDGVVARQSTDTVAVDDPCLTAALRFMSDHRCETFRLEELLQHVAISRRQLELRFRRWLNCSPHEYLCRLRVTAAKDLLGQPQSMKLRQIASACGFSSDKHLRQVFHRLVGMTPLEYQRQCREHRRGF